MPTNKANLSFFTREHRQLRIAWANAQSHQGICCSHTHQIHGCVQAHIKAVHADGGSDKKWIPPAKHAVAHACYQIDVHVVSHND